MLNDASLPHARNRGCAIYPVSKQDQIVNNIEQDQIVNNIELPCEPEYNVTMLNDIVTTMSSVGSPTFNPVFIINIATSS